MEQANNPFGAPTSNPFDALPVATSPTQQPGVNPFDPFAASQPPQQQQQQQPAVQVNLSGTGTYQFQAQPNVTDPFASQTAEPHHQPTPFQQQHVQQQGFQSYPQAESQPNSMVVSIAPQPQQQYGQQQSHPSLHAPPNPQQGALVLAPQPANPFAAVAASAPTPVSADPFGQALVPVAQQSDPWAAQPPTSASVASMFDPYAAAPVPPPVAPPPPPVEDPFPAFSFDALQQQTTALVSAPGPSPYGMAPDPAYGQIQPYGMAQEPAHGHDPYADGDVTPGQEVVAYQKPDDELVPYQAETPPESPHVNKYSHILSNLAPPGAAPLPKGDKVLKSGYVLARISFRTILLKKWKQTYWIQYGPHAMLWFRNHADFDEWLNNPYHTQDQKNFLVKLAINFVHDLYKPNVRGYQVTQSRSKQYGKKYLKQFKLERWMDYGPTIAAAFASTDPKEVDELRHTLVECMRNTPLGDGIRATGAVREGRTDVDGRQRSASFGAGDFPREIDRGYPSSSGSHESADAAVEDQRHFDSQSAPVGGHQGYQQHDPHQAQHPQSQQPYQQQAYQQQAYQQQPYQQQPYQQQPYQQQPYQQQPFQQQPYQY
ncbi:hypothetical protein MHU86_914 [Fragilaria crotonensis]|nr:hypothetical protein MHU86_914 [Fragilaria crotonensis]